VATASSSSFKVKLDTMRLHSSNRYMRATKVQVELTGDKHMRGHTAAVEPPSPALGSERSRNKCEVAEATVAFASLVCEQAGAAYAAPPTQRLSAAGSRRALRERF